MTAVRRIVQITLLTACAAVSFVSAQVYMSAKAQPAPLSFTTIKADPIAAKLAEDSALTGVKLRPMSPMYPTTKYTQAQLAVPAAKKPAKAKVAVRASKKMPMQLAYAPEARIADRVAPIFAGIR